LFAIGHFSLGYLAGKASARKLKVQLNMPLLLTASVIPDIDMLLRFLRHRGPTHSLIAIIALTIPLLILYRKTAVPYSVALASHSLIGDFFTGGSQLFWPFSTEWYGALDIDVRSLTNELLELVLFFISIAVMFKTGDLRKIAEDQYKIALLLPFGAVLGPMLAAGLGSEYTLSLLLVIPSLFYLAIFAYSILAGQILKKPFQAD
jgi:membrane-bound metal-dependent hydrolase YbcI (DUF457 family)